MRILSTEEAVERLTTGDFKKPGGPDRQGGVELDVALIDAIRRGEILAALTDDDQLTFTRVGWFAP